MTRVRIMVWQMRLCRDSVEWCTTEKRSFLRQRIQARLAALLVEAKKYTDALTLLEELLREVKRCTHAAASGLARCRSRPGTPLLCTILARAVNLSFCGRPADFNHLQPACLGDGPPVGGLLIDLAFCAQARRQAAACRD